MNTVLETFINICNSFKNAIDLNKIYNKEYLIKQTIFLNYKITGEINNFVKYIDCTEFIKRIYTGNNSNLSVYLEPLVFKNNVLYSYIKIYDNHVNKSLEKKIIFC